MANAYGDAIISGSLIDKLNSKKSNTSSSSSSKGSLKDMYPDSGSSEIYDGFSYKDMIDLINEITAANTAKSQEFAEKQMDFQVQQNSAAMEFNAEQAQINRDWQEKMSNTAYQREVKDMIAAGLNPVLAAGGTGAATTSGATASGVTSSGASGNVDTGMSQIIASLLGNIIQAQTQTQIAGIQAQSAQNVAQINADTSKYRADLDAYVSQYASDNQMNIEKAKEAWDLYIHQNYPSNAYQAVSAILDFFSIPEKIKKIKEKHDNKVDLATDPETGKLSYNSDNFSEATNVAAELLNKLTFGLFFNKR